MAGETRPTRSGSNAIDVQVSRLRAKIPTPASGSSRSAARVPARRLVTRVRSPRSAAARCASRSRPPRSSPSRTCRRAGCRVLVTRNLTAQIDANLSNALAQITHGNVGPPPSGGGFDAPPPKIPFGAPVIVWTRQPDGRVLASRSDATLPAAYYDVRDPVTIPIGNASVRIEGAPPAASTWWWARPWSPSPRRREPSSSPRSSSAGPPARRIPRRSLDRPARGGPHRAGAAAAARVHGRRIA